MMKLQRLTAIPLQATFADIYGGADKVPAHVRTPAAHFQRIPRLGQYATLIIAENEDGVRGYVEQGYTAFKLKVGRGIATDLAHIAAARSAVGSLPLYLDVNCGYDVATAIAFAKELKQFDIGWLEEPIPPDDIAAIAEVRRNSPVPIAAGENEFALTAYRQLVDADAVDILQCNIGRCGGVSGMMAIGELCAARGLTMAPHGVGASANVAASVHVGRAASGYHSYEANRLLNPLRDLMGVEPTRLENGCLVASDRIGHGGEPDMEKLEKYRLNFAA